MSNKPLIIFIFRSNKLQHQNFEKRYEGFHLEDDGIINYKTRIYNPNVAYLKKTVMDEIHKMPYFDHHGYHKTITIVIKQYFLVGMQRDIGDYI